MSLDSCTDSPLAYRSAMPVLDAPSTTSETPTKNNRSNKLHCTPQLRHRTCRSDDPLIIGPSCSRPVLCGKSCTLIFLGPTFVNLAWQPYLFCLLQPSTQIAFGTSPEKKETGGTQRLGVEILFPINTRIITLCYHVSSLYILGFSTKGLRLVTSRCLGQ